jgi:hypothetical protein
VQGLEIVLPTMTIAIDVNLSEVFLKNAPKNGMYSSGATLFSGIELKSISYCLWIFFFFFFFFTNAHYTKDLISVAQTIHHRLTLSYLAVTGGNQRGCHMALDLICHMSI